jgi:hypothetical protein
LVVVVFVLAAGFVTAFGLPGAGAQAPGTSYTGCVNRFTGQVRVILHSGSCTANEVAITLGASGPPGPQGPPGPAGTAGSVLQVVSTTQDLFIAVGDAFPFDATVASSGSGIIQASPTQIFILEAGFYRLDFILQLSSGLPDNTVQFEQNGVPLTPSFTLRLTAGQFAGSLVVVAAPGDVLELVLVTDLAFFDTGNSLIITQLSESSP